MEEQGATGHTATKLLDLKILGELVDSDPGLMTELLSLWQSASISQMDELHQAWREQDMEKAGSLAHKFKSSSRSIGALPLGDLCAELETACRDQNADTAAGLVQELKPVYEETDRAITAALSKLQTEG